MPDYRVLARAITVLHCNRAAGPYCRLIAGALHTNLPENGDYVPHLDGGRRSYMEGYYHGMRALTRRMAMEAISSAGEAGLVRSCPCFLLTNPVFNVTFLPVA